MDEGVEQLQEKSEDSGQQEAHAARRDDNGAKVPEQRKLLEIQSSSDTRAGSFLLWTTHSVRKAWGKAATWQTG